MMSLAEFMGRRGRGGFLRRRCGRSVVLKWVYSSAVCCVWVLPLLDRGICNVVESLRWNFESPFSLICHERWKCCLLFRHLQLSYFDRKSLTASNIADIITEGIVEVGYS
jgi:hypothetical protein